MLTLLSAEVYYLGLGATLTQIRSIWPTEWAGRECLDLPSEGLDDILLKVLMGVHGWQCP